MLLDERREPSQQAGPVGRRDLAPGGERRASGRDGGVGLLHSRPLELGEPLLRGRIEDGQRHGASLKPCSSAGPVQPIIVTTVDNTTTFDAAIMEQFAQQLLRKADSVRVGSAVFGGVVGVIFGAVPLTPLASVWPIPAIFGFATILLGALAGVLVGYVVGEGRAFRLRVQAQTALFQVDIERRLETALMVQSRLIAAALAPPVAVAAPAAAAAPVAPAPAPVAPTAPVAPAPAAPASMAPAPVAPPPPAPAPAVAAVSVPPVLREVPAPAPVAAPVEAPPLSDPATAPPFATG